MANFSNGLPLVALGSRELRLVTPPLRGTDVKVLQRVFDTMLDLMGEAAAPLRPPVAVSGSYDRATAAAVRRLQRYFGVRADGVAGPQTFRLLGQEAKAFGGPAFGSRPLAPGDRGGDVAVLQNRLNRLRYAAVLGHPGDGAYDSATAAALLAFQGDNTVYRHWVVGMDGHADPQTVNILWITALTGGRLLHEGLHGCDTVGLQCLLQNLGFYPGALDGRFGPATRQAVQAFQRAAGLVDNGIAGADTYYALGRAQAVFWYSPDRFPRARLDSLSRRQVVASTIDPLNGDQNPYGLAIVPNPLDDHQTVLKPGDLLVSNLNDRAGVMGRGRTLERLVDGRPERFFGEAAAPVALAVSNLGPPWIANFGVAEDGSQGNVQVVSPDGMLFSGGIIRRPQFAGPWGMQFNLGLFYGLPVAFFSANVLTGTIDRMTDFHPPDFDRDTVVQQIASGLAHQGATIASVFGPQGLVWLPIGDALYVANGADHSLRVIAPATAAPGDLGPGLPVYQGPPLNRPAGLAFNPENGNLIAVNQGDNRAIEINPRSGKLVSARELDPTPVNPVTGAGSALFGVATALSAAGDLGVYYTDDNTNTVNRLTR